MQKINLHSLPIQDAKFFDLCYQYVNIVYHATIEDILVCDNTNYPLVNQNVIRNNLSSITNYLHSSKNNKLIVYAHIDGNRPAIHWLKETNLLEKQESGQILFISTGDFEKGNYVDLELSLRIGNDPYNKIVAVNNFDKIYSKPNKPYTFLYLNGRAEDAPQRVKLTDNLKSLGLLENALWTFLSQGKFLPDEYNDVMSKGEYQTSQPSIDKVYINQTEYSTQWPDSLLVPELYIDTYFSVVSESNYAIPAHYRTEKTWKPIMIGHPFIIVSDYHCYKDLHNLGFKTFEHLIDETFDDIEDNNLRLEKITDSINSLCKSNLQEFLNEAKPICDYNRQHFFELVGRHELTMFTEITNFFKNLTNA